MKTKINFHARWPHISGQGAVLIYDRHLDSICPGFIRKFPLRYAVSGGEGLKDAARFFAHMERLAKITAKADLPRPRIIAMGGGSVGDFSGFVASVWKRGTPLVHIPSTWLAAMDSAHGGKTALNLSGIKNQIGTFYSAESVHLIQP
ncbi:MAG: hypothetical protein N2578_06535, partial [Bdellovibrionaceae bacterium]|nr:hypothetical protein [Pseudobdellovibrionaceae bacterium]